MAIDSSDASLADHEQTWSLDFQKRYLSASERFPNEILLLHDKHRSKSRHKSGIFFSTMKAASVYAGNLLAPLMLAEGMTPIDFDGYLWSDGALPSDQLRLKTGARAWFRKKGYFYGPWRYLPSWIPFAEPYQVLLLLRDPRDVLVSFYFSMAFSHSIPDGTGQPVPGHEWIREKKEKASRMTIDEFVLDQSQVFWDVYQPYCEKLLGKKNVLLVKYEHMVSDFESWLDTVISFLKLHPSQEVKDHLLAAADFRVNEENPYAHKRQVLPGDHVRKLKSETICLLNSKWQTVLEKLSYPVVL